MRVSRDDSESSVAFLLLDVEQELVEAVRALGFQPIEGGYRQVYPGDHAEIDRIYRHFETHAHDLVCQKARQIPIPWEDALREVCTRLRGTGVDWWLTGSAALAVRGLDIVPGDLDFIVARESAARFDALMIDAIVEPPRPGFISDTFTRGFLHACVEWVAGIDDRADRHMVGDVGLVAASRLETVRWHGHSIHVPPLDLQLAVTEARGLTDRADTIRRAMAVHPETSTS